MSTFERAWLYITRKKVKSIIMFFILLGIATATLSGLSIKKATVANKRDINFLDKRKNKRNRNFIINRNF